MLRERRFNYFRRAGFLPGESRELSHISRAGMHSAYVQRMVQARRGLWLNAQKYKWSDAEYRNRVKDQYANINAFKKDMMGRKIPDVWQILRYYEDRYPPPEGEYDSPWRKRTQKKQTMRRSERRVTRKGLYQQWIAGLDKTIANTSDPTRKARLEKQRQTYIDNMNKLG